MIELSYYTSAFVIGLALLVWSADRFVDGSVGLAQGLRVPPLLIGLTIVSFGTSTPEILVSLQASLEGAGDLAIGNVVGSNIANIGLVLGATAMLFRVPLPNYSLGRELFFLTLATGLGGWFLWDSKLDRSEGVALLLVTPIALVLIALARRHSPSQSIEGSNLSIASALWWLLLGLVLMIISSRMLVWGATQCAIYFGVSPMIVGLTAVALGTSLPELAASLTSAWRGQHGIALGNVLGSNIFNLLVVMAIPGMLHPLQLNANEALYNYAVMAGLTAVLAAVIVISRMSKTTHLGRFVGLIFLLIYTAYYVWLFELDIHL